MKILISNDDGIHAPGLLALAQVAARFGEVTVSAPDRERSACGHAMTMRDPLRMREVGGFPGRAVEVNGLPVDCINIGLTEMMPDGCDLILSGFNPGPNLGFDVTYSGTVGAAMEGCINGIRSIGFSMALFVDGAPAHFETGGQWLAGNWASVVEADLPRLTFLNVNVPAIAYSEINGAKWTRMGERIYQDRVERRADPWGRPYWWQGGNVVMNSRDEDTDVGAVSRGYVSITPISLDWTNHAVLQRMQ